MLDAIPKELIVLIGVAIGGGIGFFGTKFTAKTNLTIAREKLAAENRTTDAASAAIGELLRHPQWELRSFEVIQKRVRGFTEDELRKLLVVAGAVSFEEQGTGRELWGLRDRNASKLSSIEEGHESPLPEPNMPSMD